MTSRGGPGAAKRSDGYCAIRESGARVAVKADHAWTVPMAPLTRPTSTQRLLVSITRAELARQMTASSPPALSAGALAALGPV